MNMFRIKLAALVAVLGLAAIATAAIAGGRGGGVKAQLSGYEETPLTLSSPATGSFRARVDEGPQQIGFKLRYSGFETDVTQAHIHFGARATTGGISVWLCANNPPITNAPAGTPACPVRSGTVTGTITPAGVVGPAAQGIAPGEFGELVSAIRAGATYVNVHTTANPGGEIRAQLAGGLPGHGKGHGHAYGHGKGGAYDQLRGGKGGHDD